MLFWYPSSAPLSRAPSFYSTALLLMLGTIIAYLPFVGLPMISDSYFQISLARDYGSPAGWAALAADPLYRCRGTSLVFTWLLDATFGPHADIHRFGNFLVHLADAGLLVLLLRRLAFGSLTAALAGFLFAVCEVHQEAVIWVAALPELLVFFFLLLGLLAWLDALQTGRLVSFAAAFLAYLLALASKESAVVFVPLAALVWLQWRNKPGAAAFPADRRAWWTLLLAASLAGLYTVAIIATGNQHLHLTDGTFSLRAPFLKTEAISIFRILMPFGLISLALLCIARHFSLAANALAWLFITLLPYSFLTYQNRVPSRHTYLASAALAVLVAAAGRLLWQSRRRWLGPAFIVLFLGQSLTWLWTRKAHQYARRAASTQLFIDFARQSNAPIRIECAPYGIDVYRSAAQISLGRSPDSVLAAAERPEVHTRRFCDLDHP